MKKILYLIILVTSGQWLYSQTNPDSSFYPLNIGNTWFYTDISTTNEIFLRVKVIKDTTMDNNILYKVIERFYLSEKRGPYYRYERVDSSGNTFKYDTLVKKDLPMEIFSDSLHSVFQSYRRDESGNEASVYYRWSGYSSLLDRNIEHIEMFYKIKYDEDSYVRFCKGLGLVYLYYPPGIPTVLCGAIINGKEYGTLSSVKQLTDNKYPQSIQLQQNYPNPFNPSTKVKYKIDKEELVTARVFDILGREVIYLFSEKKKTGEYSIDLSMTNFNSGIYFLQLSTAKCVKSIKMLLVK
jgi:hypothetical protein